MSKKINSKTKSEKPKASKRAANAKHYEAHYLAIFLIAFLLLEGCLISTSNSADWQKGFAVLDASSGLTQTAADLEFAFAPMTSAFADINQFYQLAATEMTQLLDFSHTDPLADLNSVLTSVNDFYTQASIQMAQLLDTSSINSWPATVAGVSVSVY